MHMIQERAPGARRASRTSITSGVTVRSSRLRALWQRLRREPDPLLRARAAVLGGAGHLGTVVDEPLQAASDHSQVNQYLSGVYYVPSLHAECHPGTTSRELARARQAGVAREDWEASPARPGPSRDLDGVVDRSSICRTTPSTTSSSTRRSGRTSTTPTSRILVESWHGVRTNAAEEAIVNQSRRGNVARSPSTAS